MKTSLEHLPARKQRELERVTEIIHEEFADAISTALSEKKKGARIFKIILFGSYARGNWVDEPHTKKGYKSDYDILILVNSARMAEMDYWDKARDRLMWDKEIGTPVSIIVHSAREVNNFLHEGQYFFVDIKRDGIVLYEYDDRELAEPKPLGPADAYRIAREHFDHRMPLARNAVDLAKVSLQNRVPRHVAFMLHQATETAYGCFLLVLTNYSPAAHNVQFLRGLAEDLDRSLVDAWPREQHRFEAWFNLMKEAYVKSRYAKTFEISEEALLWLISQTSVLNDLVEAACIAHLKALEEAAKSSPAK